MPTAAPTRAWYWLLALYTIASFVETFFYGQFTAFTPLHLTHLGMAPAQIPYWTGFLAAASVAVGIPFLPLWGALADRYARQPMIVRTYAILLLAAVVTMLAPNVWIFMLGRALSSFALGNSGLMIATLAEQVPAQRVGLAIGIMNTVAPVGALVGPLLGGPLVDSRGFPALLAVDAGLLLLVTIAMAVGYRDRYRPQVTGSVLRMATASVAIVWRTRQVRALFAGVALFFGGWMVAFTYLPLLVAHLYSGADQGAMVGRVVGLSGAAALVIAPLMGALADRWGHWRVLFAGATLLALLWPTPALAGGLVSFAVLWALLNGLATGIFSLSFSVLSLVADGQVRGRVMALAYVPVNVGVMLGPALGSEVVKVSLSAVFPMAALLTAGGAWVLWRAYRLTAEVAPA